MAFSAQHADYNFALARGQHQRPLPRPPHDAGGGKNRPRRGSYVLLAVIADETDEAARAKWEHYKAGADEEALAWLTEQSQKDTRSGSDTTMRQMADPTSAVNINMGTLVGSYASVARMLMVARVRTDGVLLTFDDFLAGIDAFGERIQPLMRCPEPLLLLPWWPDDYPSRSPGILTFAPQQSALIVVDMQERLPAGRLSGSPALTSPLPRLSTILIPPSPPLAAGMLIIWFQMAGMISMLKLAAGLLELSTNPARSNAYCVGVSCRASCWRKAAGIIGLVDELTPPGRRYRVAETALQRLSLTPRSVAFFAGRGIPPPGGHQDRHQRHRRIDAARSSFLEYFGIVLEDAPSNGQPGASPNRRRCSLLTFSAGSATSSFCHALSPHPLL